MKVNVLVTGGAGFIGSHSVEALLSKGVEVRVLDNLSAGKKDNLPLGAPNLEFIEGDIRDPGTLASVMHGISHCLHLAAQVSVTASIDNPRRSAELNVMGFLTVLEAARKAKIERLVHASSAAVYGNPASLPLIETVELNPLTPYGLEKRINEDYARLYRSLHGMSIQGLRYFNVYGPRQDPSSPYAGVITRFLAQLRTTGGVDVFGDGEQTRDFIYVTDVAKANAAALFSASNETVNVASGISVSLLDLIDELKALLAVEGNVRFQSERPGDIRHSGASLEKMRQSLDFKPGKSLTEGLRLLNESELSPAERQEIESRRRFAVPGQ